VIKERATIPKVTKETAVMVNQKSRILTHSSNYENTIVIR